ncbi:aminotransferase domain protein [[Clostridium] sordellii ATCC 9714]|nr:aminotransferase domain protein [[Clostridium] sordellii ATCC 9714] [Paeniclostridium sordellii ATCC 9714]
MAIKFAKRMDGLKGSEIRELLKLTEKPEVISFAGDFQLQNYFQLKK